MLIMRVKWMCSTDGSWNFTIDKGRMGRCVNIGSASLLYGIQCFSEQVKSKFGITAVAEPLLTYWVPSTMYVLNFVKNPPVAFSTDDGFGNYQAVRFTNRR